MLEIEILILEITSPHAMLVPDAGTMPGCYLRLQICPAEEACSEPRDNFPECNLSRRENSWPLASPPRRTGPRGW